MSQPKVARYVFTVQGWDAPPIYNAEKMAYMCYGRETAPTTGQRHLQGYVRFKNRERFNVAKRLLPSGAHIEPAKGTELANRDYCRKDGDFTEFGTFDETAGKQGKRTDLEKVANEIIQGNALTQIARENPTTWIKFHSGIQSLYRQLQPAAPQERQLQVKWIWGPTGTGKTHRARTQNPGGYLIKAGRDPFGGYQGQTTVIFDEFDYNRWTIQDMNLYCDKWSMELDCRYQNKQAMWTKVIVIANYEIYQCYPLEHQNLREAFWRRFTQITLIQNQEEEIIV